LTYSNLLKSERIKEKMLTQKFLLENFFLNKLQQSYFSKRYFSDFIKTDFCKGEYIFRENEPVNFLYFIKSGDVSISINKSVNGLGQMTSDLAKKCKFDYKKSEYQLKCNPFYYKDHMALSKNMKLFILSSSDIMGGEELKFGLNRLYEAKVTSESLKCYMIDVKRLNNIFKTDFYVKTDFEEYCDAKLKTLVKRLVEIKNYENSNIDSKQLYTDLTHRKEGKNNHFKEILNKPAGVPAEVLHTNDNKTINNKIIYEKYFTKSPKKRKELLAKKKDSKENNENKAMKDINTNFHHYKSSFNNLNNQNNENKNLMTNFASMFSKLYSNKQNNITKDKHDDYPTHDRSDTFLTSSFRNFNKKTSNFKEFNRKNLFCSDDSLNRGSLSYNDLNKQIKGNNPETWRSNNLHLDFAKKKK